MLHRKGINAISIAWISTALLTTPIAGKNAYALRFDVSAIDHPISEVICCIEKRNENIDRKSQKNAREFIEIAKVISDPTEHFWMENQSGTTILLYPFLPYHSFIPLPDSHLTSAGDWLIIPSGKTGKSNSGPVDYEVSSRFLNNFGEIDLKKNTFSDYLYRPPTNSKDQSLVVIQKFVRNLIVIAFVFIIMLFFICAGLVFFDKSVFDTVLQNCFRLDKNISWNRTQKEIKRFSQFIFKIMSIVIIYIILNTGLIVLCYEYIEPIRTVIKVFSYFDMDPDVWEINIATGLYGEIEDRYERWGEERYFNPRFANLLQKFLSNYSLILIALMVYFGFFFYVFVFKNSVLFLKHYKEGVIRRKYFYYSVDLSRLAKRNQSGSSGIL